MKLKLLGGISLAALAAATAARAPGRSASLSLTASGQVLSAWTRSAGREAIQGSAALTGVALPWVTSLRS